MTISRNLKLFIATALIMGIIRFFSETSLIGWFEDHGWMAFSNWILPAIAGFLAALPVSFEKNASLRVIFAVSVTGVFASEAILALFEVLQWYGTSMISPDGSITSVFTYRALHAVPLIALIISIFAGMYGAGLTFLFHILRLGIPRLLRQRNGLSSPGRV